MADESMQIAPASAPAAHRTRWLALRILLYFYFLVVTCPIQFFPFDSTLDSSWVLAINVAADQDLKSGEDIFWTYGPLAYLGSPMPVGDNLLQASRAQTLLWAGAAIVGADLFFVHSLPLGGLLALALSTALSWPFLHFNLGGTENLIPFLAYLLLASSLHANGPNWLWRYAPVGVLCGVAALVKFSAALSIGGALAGATAVMLYRSRRKGLIAVGVGAFSALASFVSLYWMHNPSWDGLTGYLWTVRELASGYSAGMSHTELATHAALIASVAQVLLMAVFAYLHTEDRAGALALVMIFALPLALGWKHMAVRIEPMHIPLFYSLTAIYMGTSLAFQTPRPRRPILSWAVFLLGSSVVLWFTHESINSWSNSGRGIAPAARSVFSGQASLRSLGRAFDPADTKEELLHVSAARLEHRRLPPRIRSALGDRAVGIYGSNYPFAVLDELNLRLAPVPQIYGALTPALDALCADWYDSDASDHLLMDWSTIDRRHPLTQAPQSWLAVWRWYDAHTLEGDWLLLKRRSTPRFGDPTSLGTQVAHVEGIVRFSDRRERPLLAAVRSQANLRGRLLEALLRLPVILARYGADGGAHREYRAMLNVMDYPTLLSPLPRNLAETASLLSSPDLGPSPWEVTSFDLKSAKGYYRDEFEVEFYTLEENLENQP